MLVASRAGHYAGVLNYVFVGVIIGQETVGLDVLPPAVMTGLYWLVLL